jgi:hypothetical protein
MVTKANSPFVKDGHRTAQHREANMIVSITIDEIQKAIYLDSSLADKSQQVGIYHTFHGCL